MRINSIKSYTKTNSQQQNQNGHSANFGDLKRPMKTLLAELSDIPAFQGSYLGLEHYINVLQKETHVLADVRDKVVTVVISDLGEAKSKLKVLNYMGVLERMETSTLRNAKELDRFTSSVERTNAPKIPESIVKHPYDEIYDWNMDCEQKDRLGY